MKKEDVNLKTLEKVFNGGAISLEQFIEGLSENKPDDLLNGEYVAKELLDKALKDKDEFILNAALEKLIEKNGGKNATAIKALMDLNKLSIAKDGSVMGADMERLKKEYPYLFEEKDKSKVCGTGFKSSGFDGGDSLETAFEKAVMRR